MKNLKSYSGIHLSFLIIILINSLCCWEKVFIYMNIRINRKESFYSNLNMEDITDLDYNHAKRVI